MDDIGRDPATADEHSRAAKRGDGLLYWRSLRVSRGIRAAAWALVAAGVAAPAVRKRLKLPHPAVIAPSALSPVAVCVAMPRSHARDVAVVALNMWGDLAAYEMPNDDPQRLAARVRVRYPVVIDRALGLGVPPTLRLQRTFSTPGKINRFERVLAWCHWGWFLVPHASVAYVLLRHRDQFGRAAAQMYAVFDIGALFYWIIPTAPPWYAALQGELDDRHPVQMRRMMIEYGEQFWGERWGSLYDVLGGNPLAAMPSLHFATSLMAAHVLADTGPVAGAIGWSYALTLGLALVYLGEHYLADLLAGAALAQTVRRQAPRLAPAARTFSRMVQAIEARAAG